MEDMKWDNEGLFESIVEKGRVGNNSGLDNGLNRLNKYIHGTHRGKYYLIGASSSVGKTTLTDSILLQTWLSAKANDIPIKVFYCSFEVSALDKKAKWCAYFIKLRFNVELSTDYILGRIKDNYLTEEHLEMVKEGYKMVKELLKDVSIIENIMNPTGVLMGIVDGHFAKHGKVLRAAESEADKKKGRKGKILGYEATTTNMMTILVVDHLALLDTEMGGTQKQTMDKMSRYGVMLKNMFNCTCFFIQQFSTDLLSSRRETITRHGKKDGAIAITPNKLDLGDSKATYNDCDYCIGMVRPLDFDLEEFLGFNCSTASQGGLGDYFIMLYVMKNKFGPSGKMCPIFLNFICGTVYDLPIELGQADSWTEEALRLDKLCQIYSQKEN
jgi:hypothetical protein